MSWTSRRVFVVLGALWIATRVDGAALTKGVPIVLTLKDESAYGSCVLQVQIRDEAGGHVELDCQRTDLGTEYGETSGITNYTLSPHDAVSLLVYLNEAGLETLSSWGRDERTVDGAFESLEVRSGYEYGIFVVSGNSAFVNGDGKRLVSSLRQLRTSILRSTGATNATKAP